MQDDQETLVIFRRWKDTGDLIALFPELPSDIHGWFAESFMHLGQHSGADYFGVIQATKPVSAEEAEPLAEELRKIGYRLRPIKRASWKVHEARRAEARRLRSYLAAPDSRGTLRQ